MEKAIIIIDTPDNCTKCTFIHRDYCSTRKTRIPLPQHQ